MLQQEMAELHRTFQAAYPGRKGFANSGTPRASSTAGGQAGALLHLGQTPRTRELFMSAASGTGAEQGTVASVRARTYAVALLCARSAECGSPYEASRKMEIENK